MRGRRHRQHRQRHPARARAPRPRRTTSTTIAGQTARFYASDVLYKDYASPEIYGAMHAAGVRFGRLNAGQFVPNVSGCCPATSPPSCTSPASGTGADQDRARPARPPARLGQRRPASRCQTGTTTPSPPSRRRRSRSTSPTPAPTARRTSSARCRSRAPASADRRSCPRPLPGRTPPAVQLSSTPPAGTPDRGGADRAVPGEKTLTQLPVVPGHLPVARASTGGAAPSSPAPATPPSAPPRLLAYPSCGARPDEHRRHRRDRGRRSRHRGAAHLHLPRVPPARLRSEQRVVLGDRRQDLVAHAASLQRQFEALHGYVEDVAVRLEQRMGTAERRLDGAIAYSSLISYDAYGEMSGRQSISIALLDSHPTGVVLSAIHHRDQARLYAKQIHGGRGSRSSPRRRTRRSRSRWTGGSGVPAAWAGVPEPRRPAGPRARESRMRAGYFGPGGPTRRRRCSPTRPGLELETVPLPTIYDTVMAVHEGRSTGAGADRELAGGLGQRHARRAGDGDRRRDDRRRGRPSHPPLPDRPHPARAGGHRDRRLPPPGQRPVRALHPHAPAQAPRARRQLHRRGGPHRRPTTTDPGPRWATGWPPSATAASFCWPASRTSPTTRPGSSGWRRPAPGRAARAWWLRAPLRRGPGRRPSCSGAWAPKHRGGWSPACRSSRERGVNLTRIESRPRKQGLGRYMFFVDLEGREDDPHVADGLAAWCAGTWSGCGCWALSSCLTPAASPDARWLSGALRPGADCAATGTATLAPAKAYGLSVYQPSHWGPRRILSTSGAGGRLAGCSC